MKIHSAILITEDFMKIYRKYTSKPYSFLTIDTTLKTDDLLRFSKDISDSL